MILDYYKLREEPFGVTPDSRYLYESATHREALASLLYGVKAERGFVALIAKPGMGKTTLLFRALSQLREKARTIFLFQTISTPVEFLQALLADLGVDETQGNLIALQSKLNQVLLEQFRSGKPLVVVIDEAQNLDGPVLEQVRMLSNFETSREKLLQIILSGQPQLAEKLASPGLVQLRQRISMFAGLKPFSAEETALYIHHRLQTAGYSFETPLFTADALALIAQSSEGIPRNINNLCFNALSLGCALKRRVIDCEIVHEVLADLDLTPLQEGKSAAVPSRVHSAYEVPARASSASGPSKVAGWLPKFALACMILLVAVLLVLGRVRFSGSQASGRTAPDTAVRANNAVPPFVPAALPSPVVEQTPQPPVAADTIRVSRGQTLYRICVENLGSCNPERMREIYRLNPWLDDPDHIESGQKIRIPVVGQLTRATQGVPEIQNGHSVLEQAGNASSAERGMQ